MKVKPFQVRTTLIHAEPFLIRLSFLLFQLFWLRFLSFFLILTSKLMRNNIQETKNRKYNKNEKKNILNKKLMQELSFRIMLVCGYAFSLTIYLMYCKHLNIFSSQFS